jgi:hypothetical protein
MQWKNWHTCCAKRGKKICLHAPNHPAHLRYGASLGGPKTLKRNILRVFRCPILKYLRILLVNDT